ncbi:hypothetical protein [Pseudoalteromonas tunicata]|jgi:hypothetical protein|uniref:Solute-binding protein family 3/N-terminal domain-containing protein n=1 Tax=Pseudoalteromonas tunicata D2 TaxID=87626 RepID=A4C937_9GAMM|nr:hypothetical protein [Pseudoalteromonas tunicata]ATC93604.1 hypothetical protein PTUN_a0891 [Pseudoalteromonas tunicata]EAR29102.1 hypothetical protein PTD2_08659 [Pseudoalteromonas tunicata D2]
MIAKISITKVALVLITVFLLFSTLALAKDDKNVVIYLRDDVYDDYMTFLAGRDPSEINSFVGPKIRRDVVDMVIAQQALKLGGYEKTFSYKVGKVNFRNTKLIEQGELLISFDSYWLADALRIQYDVFISDPVIRKGEYFAGIFANPDHVEVFKIKNLVDLRNLTAVSTPRWATDWHTLQNLNLKELFLEDEWLSQLRMVHLKWADFMLMPLMPSLDNHYRLGNIDLKAVPNIAIVLDDSRHFVISRNHPDGEVAFKALQIGLKELRKRQRIKRAYIEAGFIPDLTKTQVINQELVEKIN